MRYKNKLLRLSVLIVLFVGFGVDVLADSFEVDGISYITNTDDISVSVTKTSDKTKYAGKITIPSSVTYNSKTYSVTVIGSDAFWQTELTEIVLPSTISSIEQGAFEACLRKNIEIPSGVTEIGMRAFSKCSQLEEVTLGSSVTKIESSAFEYCSSLKEVVIPNSVTTIGNKAFGECTSLSSITIGEGVTSISTSALNNCTNLKTIVYNAKNVSYVGTGNYKDAETYWLYGSNNVTTVTIGENVKVIPDGFMANTKALNSIVIPNSVTTIKQYAFLNSSIKDITLGEGLETIGNEAFSNCSNITEITIPKSVTTIGSSAFFNTGLKSVTLPENLASLGGGYTFYNCESLESVTFKGKLPTMTWYPFPTSDKLESINVPCLYYQSYYDATYMSNTKSKIISQKTNLATITENTYVEDCDCYTFADEITIKDGGSLAFDDYSKAATALNGKNVVLERNLPISKWSLIGNLSSEKTYEFLDKNYGDVNTTKHHGFAANTYDYTKNAWYDNYQTYNETTPDCFGSFFVYPFANELGSDKTSAPLSGDIYAVLPQNITYSHLNLGDVTFTASNTADASTVTEFGGRWFALSNPYVGRLNAKTFYEDNKAKLQGEYIYIYDNSKSDWAEVKVSEDIIALLPAMGFMVASASDEQDLSVNFTTSQIITTQTPAATYKSGKQEPITFTITANGIEKQMFAKLSETSQNGFDKEDSYVMVSENIEAITPYFVVDNRSILDNHFNNLPYTCDVNFAAYHDATAELSVANIPENIEVSIIDCQNENQQTVLTADNSFTFIADEGTNKGRYKVMFAKKNLAIEDMSSANGSIEIINHNNEITVHANDLTKAEIYNALGQMVYSQKLSGNDATVQFNGTSGAYIVKIQTAKATKSQKIIIK